MPKRGKKEQDTSQGDGQRWNNYIRCYKPILNKGKTSLNRGDRTWPLDSAVQDYFSTLMILHSRQAEANLGP